MAGEVVEARSIPLRPKVPAKRRYYAINYSSAYDLEFELGSEAFDAELVYLQFRKILDEITFSSLAANNSLVWLQLQPAECPWPSGPSRGHPALPIRRSLGFIDRVTQASTIHGTAVAPDGTSPWDPVWSPDEQQIISTPPEVDVTECGALQRRRTDKFAVSRARHSGRIGTSRPRPT